MPADIAQATLNDVTTGKQVQGQELWQEQPCVVIAFRRPGCVLCRNEAQQVWARKEYFDAAHVKVVGLLHEDKDNEVKDFQHFWPGDLYLDHQKTFYHALGGGTANKGKAKDLLNPFSQAWKNARKAMQNVKDHNMKGDGLTMGGEMVVAKEGTVVYEHSEKTFGDHAPIDELIKHAKMTAEASRA